MSEVETELDDDDPIYPEIRVYLDRYRIEKGFTITTRNNIITIMKNRGIPTQDIIQFREEWFGLHNHETWAFFNKWVTVIEEEA